MAKLTVVDGPDTGSEFELPAEPGKHATLGRDPRSQVPLGDASVSREHLRIEFTGRDYRLVDLGSKNRTFLNGEPVRESILRNGDRIGVGDTELEFEEDRTLAEEEGIESTIIKELPAGSEKALEGLLDGVEEAAGGRQEKLRSALERVRQLLGVTSAMSKVGSMDDLYRGLLEILVPAVEADRGAVLVHAGRGWTARALRLRSGESRPATAADDAHLVSTTVVRRVAEDGKAVLSAQTSRDERFRERDSVIQGAITSAIAAPIPRRPIGREPAGGRESAAPEAATPERRTAAGLPPLGPGLSPLGPPKGTAAGTAAIVYADRRGAQGPFGEAELELLVAACDLAADQARRLEEEARLRDENRTLLRTISDRHRIVGRSRAVTEVLEFIRRAAPVQQTVLVRGETGTGKELVASAIHYQGPRHGKPFVAINCAAIPENLVESELFGHERGAFTGAVARRKGRFEMADGGTVFLDEVGELSPACQAKLLRLLEDRRFERVGGQEMVEVDVRIIAATNKDLSKAIGRGEFREDLFYRLSVLGVTLSPLRERKEDISLLASHFLEILGQSKRLTAQAEEKMRSYAWPGNIRQLRNVIESAFVLSDGAEIDAGDLVLPAPGETVGAAAGWEPITLSDLERRHILKVLEFTGGNKKRAADILGIERCTLYAKLKSMSAKVAPPTEEEEPAEDEASPSGRERPG